MEGKWMMMSSDYKRWRVWLFLNEGNLDTGTVRDFVLLIMFWCNRHTIDF